MIILMNDTTFGKQNFVFRKKVEMDVWRGLLLGGDERPADGASGVDR